MAGSLLWSGVTGLVSPRTWSRAANVVVSLLAGAVFFVVLAAALIVSAALSWIAGAGSASLAGTLRLGAQMARFDRWRARRLGGARIGPPALPETPGGMPGRERRRAWIRSAAAWRLAAYQLVRPAAAATAALVAGGWWWLIAQVIGWWPDVSPRQVVRLGPLLLAAGGVLAWPAFVRAASGLDVAVARWLLAPSRHQQLSAKAERLAQARSQAVTAAEAERRRIERDLHDGLQPRLVSLAIDLGIAEARLGADQEGSRSLVARAHRDAKAAIEELRGLVRGIHPSVLDGRGLDAALSALVASCPVPVSLHVDLPDRPDHAREAAAYYVVAEAITNVAKHSGARSVAVTAGMEDGRLRLVVEDDGVGGAGLEPGGGLAGLAARIGSIDGALTVSSPPGGPTRIEAVIPCGR
jgi:signal transduction histidine kinase